MKDLSEQLLAQGLVGSVANVDLVGIDFLGREDV